MTDALMVKLIKVDENGDSLRGVVLTLREYQAFQSKPHEFEEVANINERIW